MSEKRRDNRNRILRSGESQRKDGRYAYKYTDTFGKVQFVYAWKLVPTDKTPAGNPKALQYIMGHSNITMTLNYYAHATFASARAEMERLIAA